MGFRLLIDGRPYPVTNFEVQEASTPLAAGDSSGQVGTISMDVAVPDPFLTPNHPVTMFGPEILIGKSVRLDDTRKGYTLGKVSSVSRGDSSGTFNLTALSRLGELNIYSVQAQPFIGTLENAFKTYLALAGVTTDLFITPSIASRSVVFPGWHGDLWYNLKRLATACNAGCGGR